MAMLRSLILLLIIFSVGNAEVYLIEKCSNGWSNFGVRCYKYFPQTVNWVAAERNCENLDATLASVHSKLENDFLLGLLPSPSTHAWIGAHDGEQEGQWVWTDGTAYDYNNWCSAEPNNAGGNENCLEISFSTNRCWNDWSCSNQIGYICVTGV